MAPTAAFTAAPVASPVSTAAVSIWGNSAVNSITVNGVGGTVVTATKISSPEDVPPIRSAPVYQYIEVTLERYTVIQSASISFEVPLSWIKEQHADPASIALNRYHGNSWANLPTNLDHTANGLAYYTAESPGFSIFAIILIQGSTTGAEVVPAIAQVSSASAAQAPATGIPGQAVPIASVPPQEQDLSGISGISLIMILVLCILAVISIMVPVLYWNSDSERRKEKW